MSQTGRGSEDEPGKVGRTVIAGTENVEVPGTEESQGRGARLASQEQIVENLVTVKRSFS